MCTFFLREMLNETDIRTHPYKILKKSGYRILLGCVRCIAYLYLTRSYIASCMHLLNHITSRVFCSMQCNPNLTIPTILSAQNFLHHHHILFLHWCSFSYKEVWKYKMHTNILILIWGFQQHLNIIWGVRKNNFSDWQWKRWQCMLHNIDVDSWEETKMRPIILQLDSFLSLDWEDHIIYRTRMPMETYSLWG